MTVWTTMMIVYYTSPSQISQGHMSRLCDTILFGHAFVMAEFSSTLVLNGFVQY